MEFLKNVFGGGKDEQTPYTSFEEGDVFYTEKEKTYSLFKVLKYDSKFETLHVKGYEEVDKLPNQKELKSLSVMIHHFPVAKTGFEDPIFLFKTVVEEEDLEGYFLYIKETNKIDEIVKYAQQYYQVAHQLTDRQLYEEAIANYSKAIDLFPNFFEAIDNRAFCHMDLGHWREAIEGFEQSLVVNPNSLSAVFSIGECYLRLKNYPKAKEYFEKAIEINPNHEKPKEFLRITEGLMTE